MKLIQILKRNRVFRFMSSVKMAVPLMVGLAIIVAIGTVVESRYNAQVAGLLVYHSGWFQALMALLWINILCATLMRLPFNKSHTGFVITHIGLLALLAGGMITGNYGLDGQLRVVEGHTSNLVAVPDLAFKVASADGNSMHSYKFKRSLDKLEGGKLPFDKLRAETGLVVEKYLPFVSREQGYVNRPGAPGAGVVLNFSLESPMFGKNGDWLHSTDRPAAQMGPALITLIVDEPGAKPATSKPAKSGKKAQQAAAPVEGATRMPAAADSLLVVKDAAGAELATLKVSELRKKGRTVKGVEISVAKVFEQAVVAENKLVEKGGKGENPALELKITAKGKAFRDVVFAKYPSFSLNPEALQASGLQFEYRVANVAPVESADGGMPQGHPPIGGGAEAAMPAGAQLTEGAMGGGSMASAGDGNRIEFHVPRVTDGSKPPVTVELYKAGKQVFRKLLKDGEPVETPWMGMKITMDSLMESAVTNSEVREVQMRPRSMLPDSAIYVRGESSPPGEGFWLIEGDYKTVQAGQRSYEVYYGPESVELPFAVALEKFEKIDYPGTETPMSFQSTIKLNGTGAPILISMNEPLKHEGYTLYQSSYEMGRGPTASIFSVNKDPGRAIKYVGSLIMCIGIAIFALMRSRWYNDLKQGKRMKTKMAVVLMAVLPALLSFSSPAQAEEGMPAAGAQSAEDHSGHNHGPGEHHQQAALPPEQALSSFKQFASRIDADAIAALPLQSHGRLKPFHSYAREAILYVSGKYSPFGLDPVQAYLGIMISSAAPYVEIINVRDPQLRETLGFAKKQRMFSLASLEASKLEELAKPALQRSEQDSKSLNPQEKALVEVMQQVWLTRGIISGGHLIQALSVTPTAPGMQPQGGANGPAFEKAQQYLRALASSDPSSTGLARDLIATVKGQEMPELFRKNVDKMETEVWFNKFHIFRWCAALYLIIGAALLIPMARRRIEKLPLLAIIAVPFLLHNIGFAIRVYITGFAPVTNMYGTMIWVAYGVVFFGAILFMLYKNYAVMGYILIGAALTLLLTESLPLVLSPDMDPIVAVLRNNFWLTIHVLTITISYAAFTIAMIMGNIALVKGIISGVKSISAGSDKAALAKSNQADEKFYKEYGHLTYRVIQLGVFFLTAGIILGGVWADYSWGRFWGWDPKETWSLIADLGFLAILHAKYLGWLSPFGVLAASPVGYLLVVMAWYGVNFILAAGLHSYGFSSGGAAMVATFVGVQLVLLAVSLAVNNWKKSRGGAQQTPAGA